jgi:hypothetical protein
MRWDRPITPTLTSPACPDVGVLSREEIDAHIKVWNALRALADSLHRAGLYRSSIYPNPDVFITDTWLCEASLAIRPGQLQGDVDAMTISTMLSLAVGAVGRGYTHCRVWGRVEEDDVSCFTVWIRFNRESTTTPLKVV